MRAVVVWLLVGVASVGDAAGASAEPAVARAGRAPAAVNVTIKNFDFTPAAVVLAPGGTVRWVNADVANHQISTGVVGADRPRPDGRVASPLLFRGDGFTATFGARGQYPYYCAVHPAMRGAIVVR